MTHAKTRRKNWKRYANECQRKNPSQPIGDKARIKNPTNLSESQIPEGKKRGNIWVRSRR